VGSISITNVRKEFDNGFVAIPDMSLEIQDKEFLVLVGPSGCAKSTTLRMIAGLEEITAGEIRINNRLINNLPPKERDIAMVFQNYALYPHMNVRNNIAFSLKLAKLPKAEIERNVREAAEILGIEALLDRKPRELSGGQKQRVAVGRAIVRKPEVFLFDEPLSNLDAKLRVQMRVELKKLHARLKTTIVYVTHDQVEAMTMGTRIVILRQGIIQQVGDPLTIYNHPTNKFIAGFIGSPAMNFIPCRAIEENSALYLGCGDFSIPLADDKAQKVKTSGAKDFTIGIRPEDICLKKNSEEKRPDGLFGARVIVIEPLGRECFVELNTDQYELTAIVDSSYTCRVHQEIELSINSDKIHLFMKDGDEKAIF
jgi:multiple sugar transport system ATP-binding protein